MIRLARLGGGSLALLIAVAVSDPALAYVGPGLGLSAIGAVIGLVVAFVLAVVGFIWYPIRRLRRGRREAQAAKSAGGKAAGMARGDD